MSTVNQLDVVEKIRSLGPWHQIIELTPTTTTSTPVNNSEVIRDKEIAGMTIPNYRPVPALKNGGVSLIDFRPTFFDVIRRVYPDGLQGKTILDCACNAGGYCFWAKELGVESAYGFDVRKHWIDQARFVQSHRTVADVDGIEFEVRDLYEIESGNCKSADITIFKGIFYHLPLPVRGIKLAAERTKGLFWFNTASSLEGPDGLMQPVFENVEDVMSGVHQLSWLPTGPKVIAQLLKSIGFDSIHLKVNRAGERRWNIIQDEDLASKRARFELIAHREQKALDKIKSDSLRYNPNGYFVPDLINVEMILSPGSNPCERRALEVAQAAELDLKGFCAIGSVDEEVRNDYCVKEVSDVDQKIVEECDAVILLYAHDVSKIIDRALKLHSQGLQVYKFDVIESFSTRRAIRWADEKNLKRVFVDASDLEDKYQDLGAEGIERFIGRGKRIDEYLINDLRVDFEPYQSLNQENGQISAPDQIFTRLTELLFEDSEGHSISTVNLPSEIPTEHSDLVIFQDIFSECECPIESIQKAAQSADSYFWFSSKICPDQPDGFLAPGFNNPLENEMPRWLPTGPKAIALIFFWLGFEDVRILVSSDEFQISTQRIEIMAGRGRNSLKSLNSCTRRFDISGDVLPPRTPK